MSDLKPRLPATLGRVSFWLAVAMTAVYVGFVEAAYRSDAACREATRRTRVVVDSSVSDENDLIAIGSNAGYVIVISGAKCKAGKTNAGPTGHTPESDESNESSNESNESNEGHPGNFLRNLGRQARGRGHYLWLWLQERLSKKSERKEKELPRAMVVPLSRVLCMYDEPTNRTDASSLCTPEDEPPQIEERLKTEIRNKLAPKCTDDLRISPPVVFRPYKSDQLAATTGPDSLEHAIESLGLEGLENANEVQLYVFGYASADGPRDYNRTLSKQRADHVRKLVEKETPVADTFPMGEDHLVNGVAESRGVRLVACVPSQP